MWVALGLTTVLVILVAAATLTRFGVVDFTSVLPLEAVGIQTPGKTSGTDSGQVPASADPENPEKVFNRAINQARQSIRAKRFSRAALEYNRALSVRPESVEALEGLARAYNGLGDRDRAEAVLKKAKSLRGE
jgi:tetratricopeptide (TPR) repeat protein